MGIGLSSELGKVKGGEKEEWRPTPHLSYRIGYRLQNDPLAYEDNPFFKTVVNQRNNAKIICEYKWEVVISNG